jgi:hypothetical protein
VVDHKDHDGLNNQKDNLRVCTKDENKRNIRSQKGSTSKYLGVSYDKEKAKWKTQVTIGGVKIFNKRFDTEIEAAEAYDKVCKDNNSEFSNLNFK